MKLSNKSYDCLKWIALVFLPAFEALILTIGKIWGFPYYAEVGATAAALGVFLAALLRLSSKTYYDDLKDLENEAELIAAEFEANEAALEEDRFEEFEDEDPEEPERSLPEERYDVD